MLVSCGFFFSNSRHLTRVRSCPNQNEIEPNTWYRPISNSENLQNPTKKEEKMEPCQRKKISPASLAVVSTEQLGRNGLVPVSRSPLERCFKDLEFIYRQTPQYREIYRIPSRERSHIPPGEKQNHHLQKCLGRGYDSSQEGISKYYCVWYHIPQLVHFFHDRYA